LTAALKPAASLSTLKRGVWLRVPAYILPFTPPLVITADEIEELANAADGSLTEVEKGLGV